jgi:hypothetical protein
VATESIGILIPTAIPGYTDSADIQAALRAYHYGSYSYDPANTSPASLVTPSIAKTIYDIEADITALENRPSSGGEVNDTQPAPVDFTPPEIPDGFIWVDEDGTIGGQPTSATSIFTNNAPTLSLTTGLIWVDKDAQDITANPFIPQSIISAKGDLVVGTANDAAGILFVGTNGQVLKVNSATTTGLEWGADNSYAAPTIGSTSIASGATVTTIAGLTLTSPTISTITNTGSLTLPTSTDTLVGRATTDTLTNKTLTSPIVNTGTLTNPTFVGPEERFNIVASAATGTIPIDIITAGVWYYTSNATANHTLNFRGNGSNTLNSILTTGDSVTVSWLNTNGGTPYYPNVYQVDGTTSGVTVNWSGGVAPVAGNASGIDAYSFTIVKTANATFRILAAGAVKYA